MEHLLEILLNVKPASWARGAEWRLEWLAFPRHDEALLLVAAAGIVAWLIHFLYKREGKSLKWPIRWSLVLLRLIVLAGVAAMLLEPILVFRKTEYVPSHLLVLADASDSTGLHDAYEDDKSAAKVASALKLAGGAGELRQLSRRELEKRFLSDDLMSRLAAGGDRIVQQRDFAARLLPPAARPSATDISATAIGAVIRQAIASMQGQEMAGILLLTDGQSNAGESPAKAAEFAASQGIPIVSVAIGTAQGPQWARIVKLDVSPVVFVRDANPLHVVIESRGMSHHPASIVVERSRDGGPWEEMGRQNVQLEEAGQLQTFTFQFTEERPSKLQFRARLEDAGSPLRAEDHLASAKVKAIRDKIKVLFIAGETFPEVEFIRAALLRDTSMSASTWLQTADADYEQPGDPRLKRLPETAEELDEYDCIILYDPDPALWPSQYTQLLTDFVAKEGGGLVYIAGERNTKNLYDHPDDPALAWLNLLPVMVEPGLYHTDVTVKLSTQNPWKLEITPEGKTDPIFTFDDHPQENETILESLPGMYWYFPVTRARPGATVLARHADLRMRNEYGQHVLLATQLAGPGRTFFVAFDSTYRWRYLDDRFFDSFWAHLVDRAGRSKQLGGRYPYTLSTDRASYRPGSQVTLTATFDNPADRDAALEALHGQVQVGDEAPESISLSPRPGDPNSFTTTFQAEKAGTHFVRVWTGDADPQASVKAATLEIPVELPNLEFENPTQDFTSLEAMARITGGRVFDLTQAGLVADAFKTHRVGRTLEDRQEIWSAPILWGLVIVALLAEWIVRKRVRLI